MSIDPPDEGRKFTLRLGREAVSDLEWIADQYGGITLTEVLRRAVATEKFLLEQQRGGHAIVLENRQSGRQRELVLR
ncbi:MAG: hypothetical protein WDN24_22010 [Sphingomonas sp.]